MHDEECLGPGDGDTIERTRSAWTGRPEAARALSGVPRPFLENEEGGGYRVSMSEGSVFLAPSVYVPLSFFSISLVPVAVPRWKH